MTPDAEKQAVARAAIAYVRDGMRLGLGTGSTARYFVDEVGLQVKAGWKLTCVPTSETTRRQAESLGILVSTLDQTPQLDLDVDGADEIDGNLNLIKGGGGALLREKIVASSAAQMLVIVDATKRVERLGRFPLPVEVVPFGVKATAFKIEKACQSVGCKGAIVIRVRDGKPFVTDNGNLILDCALGQIDDPPKLANALSAIPGVVEHGLFIGMATIALVGDDSGVTVLMRKSA